MHPTVTLCYMKFILWTLKKYLTLIDPQWVDSLVQDYSISSALAIELLQTCTKPLIHSSNIMNAYSYLYENNAKIMFFIVIAYSITLLTLGNKENETDGGLSWLKHISYWSGLLVQMTFNTLSSWKLIFKEYTQIFLSFSQWFFHGPVIIFQCWVDTMFSWLISAGDCHWFLLPLGSLAMGGVVTQIITQH